jgi:hypothetical protein
LDLVAVLQQLNRVPKAAAENPALLKWAERAKKLVVVRIRLIIFISHF